MRRTVTLTGAWSLKEQTLADGRLSLYNRETGTWKFFTADLEETGFMTTENMDGYFSYDAILTIISMIMCCAVKA